MAEQLSPAMFDGGAAGLATDGHAALDAANGLARLPGSAVAGT